MLFGFVLLFGVIGVFGVVVWCCGVVLLFVVAVLRYCVVVCCCGVVWCCDVVWCFSVVTVFVVVVLLLIDVAYNVVFCCLLLTILQHPPQRRSVDVSCGSVWESVLVGMEVGSVTDGEVKHLIRQGVPDSFRPRLWKMSLNNSGSLRSF